MRELGYPFLATFKHLINVCICIINVCICIENSCVSTVFETKEKSGADEAGIIGFTKCEGDETFKKDGYNSTSSVETRKKIGKTI